MIHTQPETTAPQTKLTLLQDQLEEAEYRLEIAERASDPYAWRTGRERWQRRIAEIKSRMNEAGE